LITITHNQRNPVPTRTNEHQTGDWPLLGKAIENPFRTHARTLIHLVELHANYEEPVGRRPMTTHNRANQSCFTRSNWFKLFLSTLRAHAEPRFPILLLLAPSDQFRGACQSPKAGFLMK
jgi:hypothetical protein